MKEYRYCPMCRRELVISLVEGRDRLLCPACGWINFKNPLPVIACLVSDDKNGILLVKRGVEPAKGEWALPGGFVEVDEGLKEAGARELKEETGLDGVAGDLVGIYLHESPLYGAILMIGYEYFINGGSIVCGDDADDARYFPLDQVPKMPFTSHQKLVDEYLTQIS